LRLASLWYTALKLSGLTAIARELSRGGVILCYHNVIAGTEVGPSGQLGLHMTLATFERQMRWLAANYAVVSLEELMIPRSRGRSRRVAAVTFDDGYSGVFDYAWPLLRDLNIPATVFVVAEAPEGEAGFWWDHEEVQRAHSPARRQHWLTSLRGDSAAIVQSVGPARNSGRPLRPSPPCCRPADWQTIRDAVASGLRLGAHSATHRALPTLDEFELQREVVESRDVITRRAGVTPEFFAYPYGLWDERVRGVVRSAGYRGALTLDYGHNAATADPWALPRVNVPAGIEDAAFQSWIAGLNLWHRHAS
jgi:peptidoglycan/xylan/chitin deacetylase (PgdA/CDA1 family)